MFAWALHRVPSTLLHIGVGVPTQESSPQEIAQYISLSFSYPVIFIPPIAQSPCINARSSHCLLSSKRQTPYCPLLFSLISSLPQLSRQYMEAGFAIVTQLSVSFLVDQKYHRSDFCLIPRMHPHSIANNRSVQRNFFMNI